MGSHDAHLTCWCTCFQMALTAVNFFLRSRLQGRKGRRSQRGLRSGLVTRFVVSARAPSRACDDTPQASSFMSNEGGSKNAQTTKESHLTATDLEKNGCRCVAHFHFHDCMWTVCQRGKTIHGSSL